MKADAAPRPSNVLRALLAEANRLPLAELRLRLCALRAPLQDEWARKSDPDGLYAQVSEEDPARAPELERLRGEQRGIATALRELILLSDRALTALETLALRRERLLARLRAHERRENRLLLEATLRDVGGHGHA
ncbi:MAG: hypothetical protein D6731_20565 [Planctomycetota bacterium]|nr:MAG: hypothetical protein D6731_20565 [Planctomycetota bacterium]